VVLSVLYLMIQCILLPIIISDGSQIVCSLTSSLSFILHSLFSLALSSSRSSRSLSLELVHSHHERSTIGHVDHYHRCYLGRACFRPQWRR
jgi:hypothetical protein